MFKKNNYFNYYLFFILLIFSCEFYQMKAFANVGYENIKTAKGPFERDNKICCWHRTKYLRG